MSVQNIVQTAIYNRLTSELAYSVYDHVPQDSVYPYVVIGDDTAAEWDTDNSTGFDLTLTIHTWSRYAGRKEVKTMQGAIYDALHRYDLVLSGFYMITCEQEFAETFTEADGETRHGVQRFRVVAEKE